jgi:DNA polymerase III sliding clamp (beta) subunit (PCNA family)
MNITLSKQDMTNMLARLRLAKTRLWWEATFWVTDNDLLAISTDMDTYVSAYVQVESRGGNDAVTIPLAAVDKWLKGLKGDVTITNDEHTVTFTCGNATLPVPVGESLIRLPDLPDEKLEAPAETWAAVQRVAYARGKDDARPTLTNIHLRDGRVFATDSYKLAVVDMPGVPNLSVHPKIIDVFKVAGSMSFSVDRSTLHISDERGRFVLTGCDNEPPNIQPLLAMGERTEATFDRKTLVGLVKQLDGLRNKKANKPVVFTFTGDGNVTLSTVTPDEQTVTVGMTFDGQSCDFAVNPQYLLGILNSLTTDHVTFHVADALKPLFFVEGNYTALLMPVRMP